MINQSWAAKMAQQAKVPAAKLDKDTHGRCSHFHKSTGVHIHAHKVNMILKNPKIKVSNKLAIYFILR